MKLSKNWLNDFIDLEKISAQELADLLTMKTCEVEEVYPFYEFLENFPVVLVEEVNPHPDADKLVVCTVNNGKEKLQIVTGAPNVKAGKKYAHAAVGSVLPNGMVMKKAKLRGLDSFGMLASAKEIALEDLHIGEPGDEHGLLTLPDSFEVGISLRKALAMDDWIIDIDNKSITHRPDLWSHFGFARELSILLERPLRFDPLDLEKAAFPVHTQINEKLKNPPIHIEGKSAVGYCGAVIDNIEVKPSPLSIQTRLLAVGLRPKNNMVDVSNYVMFDMGQPNHAFDYNEVKEIVVSPSKKGEKIATLDDKTHELPAGIILIRDQNTPVAIGGVIGGSNYSVSDSTTSLFVESACFYRSDIRRAVARLGIRTDASQRFEKGQDSSIMKPALHRFATLLQESCPALQMGEIVAVETETPKKAVINTTLNYIKSRLGKVELAKDEIVKLLERMGMHVTVLEDEIQVEVPTYRSGYDVTLPEDLVEEIGRMVGYLTIETEPFMVACQVPQFTNTLRRLEHDLRDLFSKSFYFSEVFTYAFCSEKDIQTDTRYADHAVELQNPIQLDLPFMRISPLPALLKAVADNYREQKNLRFFEIERIFLPSSETTTVSKETAEKNLPNEKLFLAGVLTSEKNDNQVLAYLSSILSHVLEQCGLPYHKQTREVLQENIFHPGRGGKIVEAESGKILFRWGQVHPAIAKQYRIDNTSVFYFESFVKDLLSLKAKESSYTPVSKYPATDFEVTVLMDKQQYFSELLAVLGKAKHEPAASEKTFTENIEHLTTYEGENLPQGKKAVSVRLVWRNNSRTLTPDEIKNRQEKLIKNLQANGFELRS